MEKDNTRDAKDKATERAFQLLDMADSGVDITVRDDQYDFPWLLDSVKRCRQKKSRFRLIDSGALDSLQIERLTEAGADLYTSDEVRQDVRRLEFVIKASQKRKALVACFLYGDLEERENADSLSFSDWADLGRMGMYFHITNREKEREFSVLNQLSQNCRRGGSWLVYYHHGFLGPSLKEIGESGSWIHVSDQSIHEAEDVGLLIDVISSARLSGTNLVLHLETGIDFSSLNDIVKAGGFVFFKTSLFDYKSPFRPLEREAKKRKLDSRAYYLYPSLLH